MFLPTCKGCGVITLPEGVPASDPDFVKALAETFEEHLKTCSRRLTQGGEE